MSYIYTFTNRKVWFEEGLDIHPKLFVIEDISHALSNLCRYTGHTRKFYSVAEHSVHVSYMVPEHLAMWGLLHDAAEAYVGDLNRPLKLHLPRYEDWEAKVMWSITAAFNLHPKKMPKEVKLADDQILVNEMRDLLGGTKPDPQWTPKEKIFIDLNNPWPPKVAKLAFMERYNYIVNGGVNAKKSKRA